MPSELKLYRSRDEIPRGCDPFREWTQMRSHFLNLYEVAMDYLVILATSVPF